MYLVHIRLRRPARDAHLPPGAARRIEQLRPLYPCIELVAVHDHGHVNAVVALYLRSGSLREAEATAREIWSAAVAADQRLARFTSLGAEVPLLRLAPEA